MKNNKKIIKSLFTFIAMAAFLVTAGHYSWSHAAPADSLMEAVKGDALVAGVKPERYKNFQPTPIYKQNRAGWNNPVWPATVPEYDTNRIPCLQPAVTTAIGHSDPLCNDYLDASPVGNFSISGIQRPSPHHMLLNPMLYFPFSPIAVTYNPGDPSDIIKMGFNFSGTYDNTGVWGAFDTVAVPGISPDGSGGDYALFANSLADVQMDKQDNLTPFFGVGSALDPVNLAFEPDLLTMKGDGRLPIATAFGNFTHVKIKDTTNPSDIAYRAGSNWDVAVLSRGADADSKGYLNVVSRVGLKANFTCVQDAFSDNGAPGACDPVANPAACEAWLTANPGKVNDISNAIKLCQKGTEYVDAQVYPAEELAETSNPVYMFSIPDPIGQKKTCLDGIDNSDPMVCLKTCRCLGCSDLDKCQTECNASIALGGSCDGAPSIPQCWAASAYVADGASKCTIPDGYTPDDLPDLVVVNRTGENCFNEFIRYRNPILDPASGKIALSLAADTNGYTDMEDTHGITYYKSSGATTIKPGDAGADRCSYLTLYNMVGDPPKPEIMTVTDASGNKKPVKLPMGFNASHCVFGYDFNGDGDPLDVLCANSGSPTEGIYGSYTLLVCPDRNFDKTADLTSPAAAGEDSTSWGGVCEKGFIVYDFPVTDDDNVFPAKHPWWLTAGTFKGNQITLDMMSPPSDQKVGITPADFAATYLDSYKKGAGAITVHLNNTDETYTNKVVPPAPWTNPWYYLGNIDIKAENRFLVDTYKTDDLALSIAGAKPLLPPLASDWSPAPLGITSGHFTNRTYDADMLGVDVILNDMISQDFAYSGIGGGGYVVSMSLGKFPMSGKCKDLVLGFGNSRNTCLLVNEKEKMASLGGVSIARCTGKFELPDNSNPKDKKLCTDSSSPVYNLSHNNGTGNWGNKYLAPTQIEALIDFETKDLELKGVIRTSISHNTQTERGMRADGSGGAFEPSFMYKDPNFIIDLQLDWTPDLGAINGPLNYLPEQRILSGGIGDTEVDGNHPALACNTPNYEITSIIQDTNGRGDGGKINAGPDPATPHRCWQRHNGGGLSPIYSDAAIGCCLLLESPKSPQYIGYSNLPPVGTDCPGEDPMECCIIQNSPPFKPTVTNVMSTLTTDASYDVATGNANPSCECGLDSIAEWTALIALSTSPACQVPSPPTPPCPTVAEWQTAMDNLCDCSGDAPPFCDDLNLTCDDIFPPATMPKANACCVDSGAVSLLDMIAAGGADNCPDTDLDEDDCNVTFGDNITFNGAVCICNEVVVNGDLTGSSIGLCNSGGDPGVPPPSPDVTACPEGLLHWELSRAEEPMEINGKMVNDVIFRIGESAKLVLDLSKNDGEVLKKLGVLSAGESIANLSAAVTPNVELYQTAGSVPEITNLESAPTEGMGLNSVISGKSLLAHGPVSVVDEAPNWNMKWSIAKRPDGSHVPEKEIEQFTVLLKYNDETVECISPEVGVAAMIKGGKCSLIRDLSAQGHSKWIFGFILAALGAMFTMRRRSVTK